MGPDRIGAFFFSHEEGKWSSVRNVFWFVVAVDGESPEPQSF
jgi:hypothetical protein